MGSGSTPIADKVPKGTKSKKLKRKDDNEASIKLIKRKSKTTKSDNSEDVATRPQGILKQKKTAKASKKAKATLKKNSNAVEEETIDTDANVSSLLSVPHYLSI